MARLSIVCLILLSTARFLSAEDRVLLVIAHPDDEILVAATLLACVEAGQQVRVITAVSGGGTPDRSGEERTGKDLVAAREAESTAALAALGVPAPTFLRMTGGKVEERMEDLVRHLRQAMKTFAPDTVITFGPDGLYGHPDHRAVSFATGLVVDRQPSVRRLLHIAASHRRYQLAIGIDKVLGHRAFKGWVLDDAIGLRIPCPAGAAAKRSTMMSGYPSLFGEDVATFWRKLCEATTADEYVIARQRKSQE